MTQQSDPQGLDSGALLWGFIIGLVIGGLVALFRVPQSGVQTRQQINETSQIVRDKVEATIIPSDPIAESIAEGKEAARRRRVELGLEA